ncbi:phosphoribosyltransferase [Pyxidicoccus sp. MSG2]|uniref:phosphoribosyltransferase n=1 Tax=Pyxidicoccus sp. MSG2 TaxID=2996790 RepID=UPI00226E83BE|nr:phosphoribosyltransferase family protein [Pyxidicoccus sp. MSG2]MCY1023899.1 phosphoribosyltransferase family protein [Pyxidicoccus sp. MSG2]
MYFEDRVDAGRRLAELLLEHGYSGEDTLVLGLPRGGVPVAYEVASALGTPLDVWVVRKVGAPGFQELGLGAVAEGGIAYLNRELMEEVGATEEEVRDTVRRKSAEVNERVVRYRQGARAPAVEGKVVILVDDGIATGGTFRAAIQALRLRHPGRIVLAVPVAASQALAELQPLVDDAVCVFPTPALYAIGQWYSDFHQVPDDDVVDLLEQARLNLRSRRPSPPIEPAHV